MRAEAWKRNSRVKTLDFIEGEEFAVDLESILFIFFAGDDGHLVVLALGSARLLQFTSRIRQSLSGQNAVRRRRAAGCAARRRWRAGIFVTLLLFLFKYSKLLTFLFNRLELLFKLITLAITVNKLSPGCDPLAGDSGAAGAWFIFWRRKKNMKFCF